MLNHQNICVPTVLFKHSNGRVVVAANNLGAFYNALQTTVALE